MSYEEDFLRGFLEAVLEDDNRPALGMAMTLANVLESAAGISGLDSMGFYDHNDDGTFEGISDWLREEVRQELLGGA